MDFDFSYFFSSFGLGVVGGFGAFVILSLFGFGIYKILRLLDA